MKILFDHPWPFALAHGGFQIQIEQTKAALDQLGVEVEHTRWWDESQTGDIVHYFGRPTAGYVDFAHAKNRKVVVAELHSGMGSRSGTARALQKTTMALSRVLLPKTFLSRLAWETYHIADAFVALTEWEARIMREMFGADPAKVHVVPNGIEAIFFRQHVGGDYLICTAAIHPRKRIVELAQAAARAHVPVWIIGKPYAEADAYYQRFLALQQENPIWIHYEGPVEDRGRLAEIYSGARGFVLLSTQESLSLSALEATAGGCPLLLSDLPWARTVFGDESAARVPRAGARDPRHVPAARLGTGCSGTRADLPGAADGLTLAGLGSTPLSWAPYSS
jgi:glycosyltransferase involved in cell wall biosynthesis